MPKIKLVIDKNKFTAHKNVAVLSINREMHVSEIENRYAEALVEADRIMVEKMTKGLDLIREAQDEFKTKVTELTMARAAAAETRKLHLASIEEISLKLYDGDPAVLAALQRLVTPEAEEKAEAEYREAAERRRAAVAEEERAVPRRTSHQRLVSGENLGVIIKPGESSTDALRSAMAAVDAAEAESAAAARRCAADRACG